MKKWFKNVHSGWKLGGIIALFVALAAGNMTRWSIWFDEAFSAYLMRFNVWEITRYTALDVHPPMYYWLLKGWTSLFGTTELAFRSMSVFFAIVAIIGVYCLLARLTKSSAAGLVAAFATAISPMLIRFSDEARMYTLVFAIVVWAAYALVRAMTAKASKKWWILYGLLLAVGMYTHYFIAFAFLAFWAWRWYEVKKGRVKKFWSREWLWAHVGAVALYLPWIPVLVGQFIGVQMGFWIPPLSAYTPNDYLSNMLLYREYGAVTGWWAIVFFAAVALMIWLFLRWRKDGKKTETRRLGIVIALAAVPPILLAAASIPPLSSTFMDRYVLYSQLALAMLIALALWSLRHTMRRRVLIVASSFFIAVAGLGVYNVYFYGNYNKNTETSIMAREAVELAQQHGEFGQPIIAENIWLYYEMAFYDSRDNRVYFVDKPEQYEYGSTLMLKENDFGKIKDLQDFATRHRYIWYVDKPEAGDLQPPIDGWQQIETYDTVSPVDGKVFTRTTLYDTRSNID